jgi:hypothetical protein
VWFAKMFRQALRAHDLEAGHGKRTRA